MTATSSALDRAALLDRFTTMRRRTREMFALVDEAAYYERPISLRNPIVFYEGHLPAFAVNTLVKKGLGRSGVDPHLETIFARGIDPEDEARAVARGNPAWPSRPAVGAYAEAADRLIADAIVNAAFDVPGHPLLDGAQALWAILEHEEMHQETLAYMWHQLPYERKRKPPSYVTCPQSSLRRAPSPSRVRIPAGRATLGTGADEPFAWDNERPAHQVMVDAFEIDVHDVTNAEFLDFVDAGGYRESRWWRDDDWRWIHAEGISHPPFWSYENGQWHWLGMFERVALPAAWPVYVTWAEANAFAAWRGRRLPTEAEFHRAAYGSPDGIERPPASRQSIGGRAPGNFDFHRWDPEPVGAYPDAVSPFGVYDLVGNGWEWTSSVFAPFDGFRPLPSYPEYSAEFFDGEHFVMKGASPLTARALTRRGFRNWFRPRYPYVYATFRCV
jgi:ergothioneine biosynthesis protein EgtB